MDPKAGPVGRYRGQGGRFALTQSLECAAFHAVVSGDRRVAAELSRLLEDFDAEPFQKSLPTNEFMSRGEFLEGFPTCYDWAYPVLTEGARANLRRIIEENATINYRGFVEKRSWEANIEANNHSMAAMGAVGLAGLALWHENPDAKKWADLANRKLTAYFNESFDEDGAAFEGNLYGPFGLSRILPFQAAIVKLGHEDVLGQGRLADMTDRWIEEIIPGGSMMVPLNDSDGRYLKWPGVHFLYCATTYRHDRARWVWQERLKRSAGGAGHTWPYAVLWEDPGVTPEAPTRRVCFARGRGLLTVRTGWSDTDFFACFEAGKRLRGCHCQGDHGHFLIFAEKQWLAFDTGYSNIRKENSPNQTAGHNGVLVDGKGQLTVGGGVFAEAEMKSFAEYHTFVTAVADLKPAYGKNDYNPLRKATRTFMVMLNGKKAAARTRGRGYRPYVLLVDHFAKDAEDHKYTFMLHGAKDSKFRFGENRAVHEIGGAALDIVFVPFDEGGVELGITTFPSHSFGDHPRMDATWTGGRWFAVTVLAPRGNSDKPVSVVGKREAGTLAVTVGRGGMRDEFVIADRRGQVSVEVIRRKRRKIVERRTIAVD